jgi:hypothetical protein
MLCSFPLNDNIASSMVIHLILQTCVPSSDAHAKMSFSQEDGSQGQLSLLLREGLQVVGVLWMAQCTPRMDTKMRIVSSVGGSREYRMPWKTVLLTRKGNVENPMPTRKVRGTRETSTSVLHQS